MIENLQNEEKIKELVNVEKDKFEPIYTDDLKEMPGTAEWWECQMKKLKIFLNKQRQKVTGDVDNTSP